MEAISVFGSLLSLPSPNFLFQARKVYCFPQKSFHGKPAKLFRLKATTTLTCEGQESSRKFKKLPISQWTHKFHSLSIDVSEMDVLRKEIDVLKPKVKKKTLMSSQGIGSTKKSVLMIYLLVSLNLACHFEAEIYEILNESFKKIDEMMSGEEDLYTVSIIFWVFRRYGHNMSSDVFKRFKGSNGNFKESLIEDVNGMLSLYEASHWGTTKDYILDEALSFTSSHLESFAAGGTCPPHLAKRIHNALSLSQHANMEVLIPLEYIPFYEQEKDHDVMLLKFAKLSFNLLQLIYLEELKSLTKWYKELDFESKLPPYYRDRIVENHFFVLASFFEPQLGDARILMVKQFTTLLTLDDTYDRYASLPEAECLTNSLIRWAPDHDMDKQPDYLKFVFNVILGIYEEFERELC